MLIRVLLATSLIGSSIVRAQSIKEVEEAASALVQAKKNVEAATLLGKALAKAQKKNDLVRQQQLADAVGRVLGRTDASEAPDTKGGYRDCCFAIMKSLKAKRAGACLSAHHLARALLFQNVRGGDERYLKQAAALCVSFAEGQRRGMHAKAVRMLAEGLVLARAGKHAKSFPLLTEAVDLCIQNGWNSMSVFCAIEMHAALKLMVRKSDAAKLTAKVLASLEKMSDRHAAQQFREAWTTRLGAMPADVDAAIRKLDGGAAPGGGAGGAGRDAGAPKSSIGKRLSRFPARKPLVSVKLVPAGFAVIHHFDKFKATHDLALGVTHQEDGGVALAFWITGVRLAQIDPTGLQGVPANGPAPGAWSFFDPLSRDETWSLNKRGEVSIK